ncbi:MAG TPA: hypothetical protein VLI39_15195 [Sedimentisphaerales bacterium]|nr:hypothetical protein [Sedimentisphaerales bacterium]
MQEKPEESHGHELPSCVAEFIRTVTRKMRFHRRARDEVREELTAHFQDELGDCTDADEREQRARRLIGEFGDPGLLAVLCRRAKKRCRPLWVRAVARTLQVVGVFLLVFIPYTMWFVRGKPNPTTDYLPQLNALHHPLDEIKDNAWPYYERAMHLAVEPNEAVVQTSWLKSSAWPDRSLTPHEHKAREDWITANSPAWAQLELGASKSQSRRVSRPSVSE